MTRILSVLLLSRTTPIGTSLEAINQHHLGHVHFRNSIKLFSGPANVFLQTKCVWFVRSIPPEFGRYPNSSVRHGKFHVLLDLALCIPCTLLRTLGTMPDTVLHAL